MSDLPPQTVPEQAATQTFSTRAELLDPLPALSSLPIVPGYDIVRMIGRGGMGVVYEARDKRLNRTVALKMILMGPHASDKDRERFRQEAEAVAQLQHPGIVQIYEIGESSTGPFLALEYVPGGSLLERLDGKPWMPLIAARLMEQITRAVEAAHQAGIVHRDLKPANILISDAASRSTDSRADATTQTTPQTPQTETRASGTATVKITDFGLAKRLDSAQGQTASGAILGTPSYMAPEQAEGRSSLIGPVTDIYALGAVLYELLTGRPPFLAETPFDTIMQVAKQEPVPPSLLNPKVPADLETICLKCLRKEKDRRYPTALALADDLHNFCEGRPIAARPIGKLERGWRWCRRNPAVATLLAAVAVLLIAGTVVATYFAVQAHDRWKDAQANAELARRNAATARQNLEDAIEARRLADRHLYVAHANLAQIALRDYRPIRLRDLLEEMKPADGAEDHRGWEWHYLNRQVNMEQSRHLLMEGHAVVPGAVALAPEHSLCAAVYVRLRGDSGPLVTLAIHNVGTGQRIFAQAQDTLQEAPAVAISQDGSLLAESLTEKIRVWDIEKHHVVHEIPIAKGQRIHALALSGTKRLAIAEGTSLRVVDPLSGKQERNIAVATFVYQLVFDDRNSRLYFGQMTRQTPSHYDSEVLCFDFTTNTLSPTSGPVHREPFAPFAVSRSGAYLAVSQGKKRVQLWNTRAKNVVGTLALATDAITSMAFVRNSSLAVGSANGLISIYSANVGEDPVLLRSHSNPIVAIGTTKVYDYFSLDASTELRTWDAIIPERQKTVLTGSDSAGLLGAPDFSASGQTLHHVGGIGFNRGLILYDFPKKQLKRQMIPIGRSSLGVTVGRTALSHNERVVAGVLVRHEGDPLSSAANVLPGLAARFGGPAPLSRTLIDVGARVIASDTDVVRLHDLKENKPLASIKLPEPIHQMFLSEDGRHLLTVGSGWRVHETGSGKLIESLDRRDRQHAIAAVHPNGRSFAVAVSRKDNVVVIPKDGKPVEPVRASIVLREFGSSATATLDLFLNEQACTFSQLHFSPGGRYLVAVAFENATGRIADGSYAFRLLIWKANESGTYERLAMPQSGRWVAFQREHVAVAFHEPNDLMALVVRRQQQSADICVWTAGRDQLQSSFRAQSGSPEFAAFATNGRRLLVVSGAGGTGEIHGAQLRVFDPLAKQELLEIPLGQVIGGQPGVAAGYHFDGHVLRAAALNEKGGEIRVIDGSPLP